jgi:hypothetical protein
MLSEVGKMRASDIRPSCEVQSIVHVGKRSAGDKSGQLINKDQLDDDGRTLPSSERA